LITAHRQQRTLARPVQLSGVGYWTGKDIHVEFRPAAPETGLVFVRSDMAPIRRIRVAPENRVVTPRRTTVTENGATVEMVEHLLAALAGLQIDNCEICVDAQEMPALDGSSQAAVKAIESAGVVFQDAHRPQIIVDQIVRVGDDDAWIEARPYDRPGLFVDYHLDYGSDTPIGTQQFSLEVTPKTFCQELAKARTFVLEADAKWMQARGLGSRTTYQDLLVFGKDGPIENKLRFEDECVRHKILDLVGDLALSTCDIHARIHAHRSGHRLNADLVRLLLDQYQATDATLQKSA
jgi:UDP-3-O-acyl N-acetylglucosamine deacetylase